VLAVFPLSAAGTNAGVRPMTAHVALAHPHLAPFEVEGSAAPLPRTPFGRAWGGTADWSIASRVGGSSSASACGLAVKLTSAADRSSYQVFWIGVRAFMVPSAVFTSSRRFRRASAGGSTLVKAYSLFLDSATFLPRPTGPLYHD